MIFWSSWWSTACRAKSPNRSGVLQAEYGYFVKYVGTCGRLLRMLRDRRWASGLADLRTGSGSRDVRNSYSRALKPILFFTFLYCWDVSQIVYTVSILLWYMRETNQNDSFVLPVLTCLRCGHTWPPRKPELPKVCPKCKSPYWNQERQVKKSKKKDEKREYPPYLCCQAQKRYEKWYVNSF